MHSRPVTCLLAALTLVVSTAGAASAETVMFTDRRGDASARYDLTRTSIRNGDNRFTVVQRVRNLRGGRPQIYGVSASAGDAFTVVHTVRRKNGTVVNTVYGPDGEVACDIRARWWRGKDTIRVSMPRDCIAEGGTVRVRTMIGAGNGSAGDPDDCTRTVRVRQG